MTAVEKNERRSDGAKEEEGTRLGKTQVESPELGTVQIVKVI